MCVIGICDDNVAVCAQIEQHLLAYAKEQNIKLEIEVFLRGEDLLKALKYDDFLPNLLFLDIELGDTDGIELGNYVRETLNNETTQIVYISYSKDYALQLFKIRPMDFLIKPIDYEKVTEVMQIYRKLFLDKNQFFSYKRNRKNYQVAQKELIYVACQGKKICLVTAEEEFDYYGKMADVRVQLDEKKFWTIHKSYIINIDYVFSFGKDEIKMINKDKLPVSRAYRKDILKKLQDLKNIKNMEISG